MKIANNLIGWRESVHLLIFWSSLVARRLNENALMKFKLRTSSQRLEEKQNFPPRFGITKMKNFSSIDLLIFTSCITSSLSIFLLL